MLLGKLLDHGTVSIEFPAVSRAATVTQLLELARAQVGHCRHRANLDLLFGRRLDVAQQAVLAARPR